MRGTIAVCKSPIRYARAMLSSTSCCPRHSQTSSASFFPTSQTIALSRAHMVHEKRGCCGGKHGVRWDQGFGRELVATLAKGRRRDGRGVGLIDVRTDGGHFGAEGGGRYGPGGTDYWTQRAARRAETRTADTISLTPFPKPLRYRTIFKIAGPESSCSIPESYRGGGCARRVRERLCKRDDLSSPCGLDRSGIRSCVLDRSVQNSWL